MDLEQKIKELEQKISSLESELNSHNSELVIISDFMNFPGKDGAYSAYDVIQEAKNRNWFK